MSASVYIEPDVAAWIRSKLVADATLLALLPDGADSIFTSDPVQGAAMPYLVIQLQGTPGVFRRNGPYVAWEQFLYLVKFVGEPSDFATMKAGMKLVHSLIDNQIQQTHDDAYIDECLYERAFSPPADAYYGTLTKQVGGFFRVDAHAA